MLASWTKFRFQANGPAIAMLSYTDQTLNSVWGTSATDVFAVGGIGTILHYDGVAWSQMVAPNATTLGGVGGASGDDVYAVGASGMILVYDGARWEQVRGTGAYLDLSRVYVNELDQVWIVGVGGAILVKEHPRSQAQRR